MPKQVYKIIRFEGGINNNSDPRDLEDNQFVELQNMAVDNIGKLVVNGDMKTQYTSPVIIDASAVAIAVTSSGTLKGAQFIVLETDYDGFADGTVALGGQAYYICENGNSISVRGDDNESGTLTGNQIGNEGATFYYVDGALRWIDRQHQTNSKPRWRGYIPAKT